jgi:hypothetical protein
VCGLARRRLGAGDARQLQAAIDNLSRLAEEACSAIAREAPQGLGSVLVACVSQADRLGFRLLLDAEQTPRQPAIDHMALALMRRFNRHGRPVVYNTYQCYLDDARERMERDLRACQADHATFAAKVRCLALRTASPGRAGPGWARPAEQVTSPRAAGHACRLCAGRTLR